MHSRKANLDLLRAIAIITVVCFHISQYVDTLSDAGHKVLSLGAYGVDIFFVLSGWLIGSLYFREYQQTNRIDIARFWGRRWLRTLPPYYVALFLSWFVVYLARKQPFDFGYLLFLQNYYPAPPFFLISWSLCIEEHFYVFMPLIVLAGLRSNSTILICLLFIGLSLGLRVYNHIGSYPPFGYLVTATHLRLDGLALGILAAYLYTMRKPYWQKFSQAVKIVGPFFGIVGAYLYLTDHPLMYSLGLFLLSAFFLSLLCYCVDLADGNVSRFKLVSPIALSSYSIYLTHALVIHVANRLVASRGAFYVLVTLLLIFAVGYCFYLLVELMSIKFRDRILPASNRKIPTSPV